MNGLTKDYIALIAKWLEPLDIMRWAIAQPRFSLYLEQLFYRCVINKIDNWFQKYFDANTTKTSPKYADFVKSMIKTGSIISGSFILQMINCKYYGIESDIDIYIPFTSDQFEYIDDVGDDNIAEYSITDVENVLWLSHDSSHNSRIHEYVTSEIRGVREYYHGLGQNGIVSPALPDQYFRGFQTVTIEGDIRESIRTHFDFNILKNFFWYDDSGAHIEITNLFGILHNTIDFDKKQYYEKMLSDLTSTVTDSNQIKLIYEDKCKKIEQRIQKYTNRGFNVRLL